MVKIIGTYKGGLKMEMVHAPSNAILETDPPIDNGGQGLNFSPTDLVATGLGACMMSVMAIAAKRDSISLIGMSCIVEKHMSKDLPRRIVALDVMMQMPKSLVTDIRAKLEQIANTCPVIQSLHPEIRVNKSYIYT